MVSSHKTPLMDGRPIYFLLIIDLSDDSYGTVVNMTMDQDGSSPHSGAGRGPSFLHGGTSPSFLPGHTPPHGHEPFSYADQLSVYSSIGLLFNIN